jgi:hypothetical protein
MRGRFADDGALYTCGLYAWAGNATSPGGFHRIRRGTMPAQVPLTFHAGKGVLSVTFSDPVSDSVSDSKSSVKTWSLKRSKNYGSSHYDERELSIREVKMSSDRRTVFLEIPDLAPTQCCEVKVGDRVLHGTIHQIAHQ